MSEDFTIRPTKESDRKQWEVLWKGYQEFYETNLDDVTEGLWMRLLSDDLSEPICLVAEQNDELYQRPLGFTLLTRNYFGFG